MSNNIDYYGKILWDYHKLNQKTEKVEIILGLGSHDLFVARRCAELFLKGYGDNIIFTGGFGRITKNIWNMTEGEKFTEVAIDMGVPKNKIIIENKASNTGENISKTKKMLKNLDLYPSSFLIVDKPYRERRTFATIKKQWPEINFLITSPQHSYEEYCSFYSDGEISKDEFISIMVGDLQRIDLYGKNGFQIKQDIPVEVIDAYDKLISFGYVKQLLLTK
ncbi:YdcF family protein [Terrisporobacter petrolearius]|uniref:YdcF family protein n=1 Tax=Terrisporobacter petrolearius TaxID=1460447 RepID=UPI001D167E1D|nr:YdcF family protein [Terrisporobacter petrolearius]